MHSSPSLLFGWSINKWLLVVANICSGIILILLSFTGVLPLDMVDFIFFSFVGFLAALYRPGWMFLLLIGMLPYEILTIAPAGVEISIRPYQWLLVLVTFALCTRFLMHRFPLQKFVPNKWDATLTVFVGSAFLSALMSDDQAGSMRLVAILFSFLLLYFVSRLFVRSIDDARTLLPFFFSSFLVIALYAITQNILFLEGTESIEIMAGRPHGTFPEADWLGGYLAVLITALVSLIVSPTLISQYASIRQTRMISSLLLFFGFIALILTVSRSAWFSALCGVATAFTLFGWQRGIFDALYWENRQVLKRALYVKFFVSVPFVLAIGAVFFFDLTPFDLWDRGRSLSSGEQRITVACDREIALPEKVATLADLAGYGCAHIRLQEIDDKRANGMYVTEVFRDDPNVRIRGDIYVAVADILKTHWFAGIGFGAIAGALGTDERGAGLNASNIFLEIWLGAGLIGLLAILFFWCGVGWLAFSAAWKNRSPLALTLSALWVAATVFNLFNAGLLLGWFFVLLALLTIITEPSYGKR